MSKLAWVLLPALLVTALVLLRRPPGSRPWLNAAFSLLLLAYLGTTAGLGLFWVANQQLPAFDWHYLFGYVTLLLLVLHLAFNLPTLWRVLRPRAGLHRAPSTASRRPLLMGSVAALAAGGVGYVIGLRHGRVELRIDATGALAEGARDAGAGRRLVEAFHALSSHSRRSLLRHAGTAQWGDAPPAFKPLRGAERIALPPPGSAARRGDGLPDLVALADVLWHGAGVSLVRGGIHFRTAPSSGALFATELYLWSDEVPALRGRWWHYDSAGHALEAVDAPLPGPAGAGAMAASAASAPAPECCAGGAKTLIVASALFARSGHKYGDRTWRYVLADAGHVLENLLLVARGLGLQALPASRFDDAALGRALALEPQREGVLAVVVLGPASAAPEPAGRGAAALPSTQPPPSGSAAELTVAMHAASALPGTPLAWGSVPERQTAGTAASPPARDNRPTQRLPAAQALPADVRPLIAKRRSVRRYAQRSLGPAELATLLAAARGAQPRLSLALGIDVITPAVTGLPAAVWRYDGAGLAGHGTAPDDAAALRQRARAAALDQDVIGNAAVVLVLSLDRALLQGDALGAARAYRHGFIEAGLAGERVYLAAAMLGLGCCGVGAFYDDEMSALVGRDPAHHWVVHLVAIGPLA